MSDDGRGRPAEELGQRLASVERRAGHLSAQLADACRVAESLKIDVLRSKLAEERRLSTLGRGVTPVLRDGRNWVAAAAGGALGLGFGKPFGLDKEAVGLAELRWVGAALRQAGESSWAVSLDRRMAVVAKDEMTTERSWVTWENLQASMGKLRARALAGEELGDLATVVSLLSQDFPIRRVVVSPIKIRIIPIPEKGKE